MMERIGLIGYGAIGSAVHRLLRERASHKVEIVAILVQSMDRALRDVPQESSLLVRSLGEMLERHPTLVVECASHEAVDAYGALLLQAGADVLMVSVGALADSKREESLVSAARKAQRKLLLPSGAIGGIDWLAAASLAGLSQVTYRSRKPPQAWFGSAAEQHINLATLSKATSFYQGSAREAALLYPKNANVAATIALATLGFDATKVELIADPEVTANIHEVEAESLGGRMKIQLEGVPDDRNPRSSVMTAYSVVRSILNRTATMPM
jgi:aspartate dehydrogenase